MKEQISIKDIENFQKKYKENKNNKKIEKELKKYGIDKTCLNIKSKKDVNMRFNIELEDSFRYNQGYTSKCWIYAGFNVIEYNISNNLNMEVKNLVLSNNYISFFDKLEKSNNVYENLIKLEKIDYKSLHEQKLIENGVLEFGTWSYFKSIVQKYGIMPMIDNEEEPYESINSKRLNDIFIEKVKKDSLDLVTMKNNNASDEELRKIKLKFLEENYILLSKILGEPKTEFSYTYKDKDDNIIELKKITPKEFADKYLTLNLDDFIVVANMPMYNKVFNRVYRYVYSGNIYRESQIQYLNLEIEELKEIAVKQLIDGVPVYVGTNITKDKSNEYCVLDTNLYDYKKVLGVKRLTKKESLNLYDITWQHIMTIKGVNIQEKQIKCWKLEDSFGNEEFGNGYFIMNDNYFSKYVLYIVVNKKYLSESQINKLKEPIEDITD